MSIKICESLYQEYREKFTQGGVPRRRYYGSSESLETRERTNLGFCMEEHRDIPFNECAKQDPDNEDFLILDDCVNIFYSLTINFCLLLIDSLYRIWTSVLAPTPPWTSRAACVARPPSCRRLTSSTAQSAY